MLQPYTYKYFILPALVGLVALLSACSSSDNFEEYEIVRPATKTVTLTVNHLGDAMLTRAGELEGDERPRTISDGSYVDKLVFAVYQVRQKADGTPLYTLDYTFSKESTSGPSAGPAQNILTVPKWPVSIQLALEEGKQYKVAFWAQNSTTQAFDTKNLEKVEVKYFNAVNNDEMRDAFCGTSGVLTTASTPEHIYLRRPLAQINVGTPGWDFEREAVEEIDQHKQIVFSRTEITLKGLARYFNVLENRTLNQDDLGGENASDRAIIEDEITLNPTKMPAFMYVDDVAWKGAGSNYYLPFWREFNSNYSGSNIENFLFVDMDGDGRYKNYISWNDQYVDANGNSKNTISDTEMFKYLSMCYVLVPEATEQNGKKIAPTLPYLRLSGGEWEEDTDYCELLVLRNVPVGRNWRTNIISECLYWAKTEFTIYVVPDYLGDYNNVGNAPEYWQDGIYEDGDLTFVEDPNNDNVFLVKPGTGQKNDNFPDHGDGYKD